MNFKDKYGPWALVTGASGGIGYALADELASLGLNVVTIARSTESLTAQKQEIEAKYGVKVNPLALDVATPSFPAEVLEATAGLDIGLVVPNAGTIEVGDFAKSDAAANKRLIAVNVEHPVMLANAFASRLVARGRGGIVLLSSTFGYQGVPYLANYAAGKAFILAFGEALHVELKRFGVDVTVLSPGLTRTSMSEGLPLDLGKLPIRSESAAAVARFAVSRLGRTASAAPGILNNMFIFFNRLSPRILPVALFGFLVRRAFRRDARGSLLIGPQ